jgi:hypothetical protein
VQEKEQFMKRLGLIAVLATTVVGVWASGASATIATTFNAAAAPTGTHLQTGTIGCTVDSTTLLVTCSAYELAGVGNADATATLDANYTATVQCRNHGGQIVEVKSQAEARPTSSGRLHPKNGRLDVTALSSGPVPSARDFEAMATCPNGNWTKELLNGSVALSSFTYTLHFTGFTGNYVTITGP